MKPPCAHPLALERLADARRSILANPQTDHSISGVLAAAIAIATHAKPTIKPKSIHTVFDRIAADVKHLLTYQNPLFASLRHVLFDRYGFVGHQPTASAPLYSIPDHSYIDHVLTNRVGLPILLSLIYVETARRAGGKAYGIGLPGHFIAALETDGQLIYIDCFNAGRVLSTEDCRRRVLQNGIPWREEYLTPADARSWILRILMNLRNSYHRRRDPLNHAAILEMMLLMGDDTRHEELQRLYKQLKKSENN